jgi:hypothetical protein
MLWSNWCGGELPKLDVLVVLPDGGEPILTEPEPIQPAEPASTPRCDAPGVPSGLGVFAFAPAEIPTSPPEPQPAGVDLGVPPKAAAGEVLTFTVTLTNLGDLAAMLDPCPTYWEDLIVDGRALKLPGDRQYFLNCLAIGPAIAPGDSVVLEMRYLVPMDVRPGLVDLIWSIDGPFDSSTAFAKAPLEITAP